MPETEGDRALYEQVKSVALTRGSLFVPIQLQITKEEHLKRVTRLERSERFKSIDPRYAEDNGPLFSIIHPHLLEMDVSNLSAADTAQAILNHVNRLTP